MRKRGLIAGVYAYRGEPRRAPRPDVLSGVYAIRNKATGRVYSDAAWT